MRLIVMSVLGAVLGVLADSASGWGSNSYHYLVIIGFTAGYASAISLRRRK